MSTAQAWRGCRKLPITIGLLSLRLLIDGGGWAAPDPLSPKEYRRFALLHDGDAGRGQALFNDEQRLACSRCHTVDGTARKAGPDLFAAGDTFGRQDLIDSILSPSMNLAVGYSTTRIVTTAGEESAGIIKQVTDESITLMGSDAVPLVIPKLSIKEIHTSEVSLMPEGLQNALSLQEFTDLVDYLVTLKQPANAALVHEGMPATIPFLLHQVKLQPYHPPTLKFEHPVWFGQVPGDPQRFLVIEHETGRVWCMQRMDPPAGQPTLGSDNLAARQFRKSVFLETGASAEGTRGLIGFTFHPRFEQNRKYYLAKHVVENGHFATLIVERTASADGISDSGKPPRLILKLDAVTNVHYGGSLAFGPDGYLYIGMGDTGPQEDPQGHGQNTDLLLGKILRVDVEASDVDRPYRVPPDNPFLGKANFRPEIWAYGLREPWRFSFDRLTGDLWVGDVGQDRYEEVDIVRRGENYGWNVYEGFERFSNQYRRDGQLYVPPVFAYQRKYGPSVTGGVVYRADPKSSFYGVYIFGDFQSQRIFGITQENRTLKSVRQIGSAPQRIVSFGCDEAGQLYLVGYEGTIFQIDLSDGAFD